MDLTLTKIKSPFIYAWKIPESQIQRLQSSVNGFVTSDVFHVFNLSGVKYFFEFYPNGRNENREKAEIFLYFDPGKDRRIEVFFKVSIESADISIKCSQVFEAFERKGIICRKTKHLFNSEKKFFIDGFLVIKIEGTLKVKKDAASENRIFDNGKLNLWEQKNNNKNFIIVVGGKEIEVHKNVLASESIIFGNYFASITADSVFHKVEITDYPYHIVETAVKFCYYRNFVTPLTLEDVMLLLQFFDEYKADLLKRQFEEFLVSQISISTVFRLSKMFSKNLMQKCCKKNVPYFMNVNFSFFPLNLLCYLFVLNFFLYFCWVFVL
uniref:BTB domain-containing protein n=1 Tax=Panagrolaimus superbus TaxID=310955 RepID=A0A914Z8L9_9BILA